MQIPARRWLPNLEGCVSVEGGGRVGNVKEGGRGGREGVGEEKGGGGRGVVERRTGEEMRARAPRRGGANQASYRHGL